MIQIDYGYDRANSEKIYDYHAMQGNQILFNTAVGAFAAYKAGPFQKAAGGSYVLFRKTWMKVPIRLGAFGCFYYVANMAQNKVFPKFF